ncbi:MAG: UDP-N-acetylglucosamine 1-carboxyvinyltransferase [Candidatus Taylorbacteria bacterium]|nr:UDP-N-acetylglucosamine 1-carboxyvinyltransferase [Candidatus Taylorbacteria bacterium]
MDDYFEIEGLAGKKLLSGEVEISGAKNAVLPLLAAGVLFDGKVSLENAPIINDTRRMLELLSALGAKTEFDEFAGVASVNCASLDSHSLDVEISKRLRASIILSGPILGRYGEVEFPHPGGCVIGERPIDIFVECFSKMGARAEERDGIYRLECSEGLKGTEVFMRIQSVTATETLMMAAALAKGETNLKNCAMEPEVAALAGFLRQSGVEIEGAGTPTIKVKGRAGRLLSPRGRAKIIPDRIEAGSFIILGALCADELVVKNCVPAHLEAVTSLLAAAGVPLDIGQDFIRLSGNGRTANSVFKNFNVRTHEYPGFPTDLQAPMAVFLTQASGEGLIFETIFEGRLGYTEDLIKMGAGIKIWDAHRASVKGPTPLNGRLLEGPDIRAGLALVIAALAAEGRSQITNVRYLDRGYERIDEKLRSLGALIERKTLTRSKDSALIF